jgi:hypothetical protein
MIFLGLENPIVLVINNDRKNFYQSISIYCHFSTCVKILDLSIPTNSLPISPNMSPLQFASMETEKYAI